MNRKQLLSILFIVTATFFANGNAFGASYYVDGKNGSDQNSGTIDHPWQSVNKANKTLKAGDTVYLRSGNYTEAIVPVNSGEPGKYITYQRYPNDSKWSVVFATNSFTIHLDNKDYIKIDGIHVNHSGYRWAEIGPGSSYNIIQNSKFYDGQAYSGIRILSDSSYTKLLNNIFLDAPLMPSAGRSAWDNQLCGEPPYPKSSACNSETAPADIIRDYGTGTLIQGNTFGNSSHQSIYGVGKNCVYRNNVGKNEYHSMIAADAKRVLVEGNVLSNGGYRKDYNPSYRDRTIINGAGLYIMADYSIVRGNVVRNSDYGLYFGAKGGGDYSGNYQHFYNNTLYNNWLQILMTGNNSNTYNYNEVKNNAIFNDSNLLKHKLVGITEPRTFQIMRNSADAPYTNINFFVNNAWTSGEKTFYFKHETTLTTTLDDLIDKYPNEWFANNFSVPSLGLTNISQNDFRPASTDSSVVDSGDFLTTIASDSQTGQSQIKVADAHYFYDGWGIPGEVGDKIQTQHGQKTTIQTINYSNNLITVAPAIDIVKGEGLSLAYSGDAPDIGAYEFMANDSVDHPPTPVLWIQGANTP